MKKSLFAIALAVFVIVAAGRALTQEKSQVKVKGSQVVSGVVVVDILKAGKPFRLQCNQGAPSCTLLKAGDYTMIELPENTGLYDCKNVEMYAGVVSDPKPDDVVGNYCIY